MHETHRPLRLAASAEEEGPLLLLLPSLLAPSDRILPDRLGCAWVCSQLGRGSEPRAGAEHGRQAGRQAGRMARAHGSPDTFTHTHTPKTKRTRPQRWSLSSPDSVAADDWALGGGRAHVAATGRTMRGPAATGAAVVGAADDGRASSSFACYCCWRSRTPPVGVPAASPLRLCVCLCGLSVGVGF
jgi:hypothetical protein